MDSAAQAHSEPNCKFECDGETVHKCYLYGQCESQKWSEQVENAGYEEAFSFESRTNAHAQ